LNEIIYQSIKTEELTLDRREAANRLRVPRDFDMSVADEYKTQLESVIDCKMAAVRVPLERFCDKMIMGEIETDSKDLERCLGDSREVFIFAVTLGAGVDRLLLKYSRISPAGAFMADAVANAYAEAAADRAQEILDGIEKTKNRFSPGYGDLPLEIQPKILETVNAGKLLGVTLTDSLLMKPQKTITAIAGINRE